MSHLAEGKLLATFVATPRRAADASDWMTRRLGGGRLRRRGRLGCNGHGDVGGRGVLNGVVAGS